MIMTHSVSVSVYPTKKQCPLLQMPDTNVVILQSVDAEMFNYVDDVFMNTPVIHLSSNKVE